MEENRITGINPDEYTSVINVWEASVRATHHFLKEEDIQYYKPLILNQYLQAVELFAVRNNDNEIIGFSGITEDNIEMLFIDPLYRGKGIGKTLILDALKNHHITKVSVNEQNEQALGFYLHIGFSIKNRHETDGSGKPYPILDLEYIGNSSGY